MNSNESLFDNLGGAEGVHRLVEVFYSKVQLHPQLSPLFPEDITPVLEKQYQFLSQFFGGPALYSEQHGHPMMRARHMHIPITPERADDWLNCMKAALEETGVEEPLRSFVLSRLAGPAHHFVNMPHE
ncbi:MULTISPECIES: globin domain-containing protein [Paenibacillus]|jgi:hemoglobin|uniref:Globin n=1 Tax=Paenibacillus phytohabitans TaxID=2654978 RepID=A0ABX1YQJ2_9BACL|nr:MULTISPECIES: globin [Paenibacillus]AIQ32204.1 globin [Paenibacillus sp. FSL P4-0081]AIQ43556.1 globin [Paenibacillus sp. FSL R5-0912]NOU82844.1 globin [Paenibacillus phytohabitans]OMF21827.1 globin [Paenibacillus sp. FSL H8-0259]